MMFIRDRAVLHRHECTECGHTPQKFVVIVAALYEDGAAVICEKCYAEMQQMVTEASGQTNKGGSDGRLGD